MPRRYAVLGTDGFGRSDTRAALRDFFEVGASYIALAALTSLAAEGRIRRDQLTEAIRHFGLDTEKPNPLVD